MPARTAARLRRLEAELQEWEVAASGGRSVEGERQHEQRQNALCDRVDDSEWDDTEIDALIAAMAEQADLVDGFVASGLLPRECDLLWYDRLGDVLLLTPRELRLPMLRQLAQRKGDPGVVPWLRSLRWERTCLPAGLTKEAVAVLVRVCLDHAEDLDRFSMRRCAGCKLFWPCRKQPSRKSGYEPWPPELPELLACCPHCGETKWEWTH